jgi:hypothetical protein
MRVGDDRRLAGGVPSPVSVLIAGGVALTVLVLAGCAGERAHTPSTPSPSRADPTIAGPTPRHIWLAVFEAAEDPNGLDAASQDLLERVGRAVVVAPEGCFGGLRAEEDAGLQPGDYILAVMAGSKERLEKVVNRTGREPRVIARVEDLCPV